MARRKEDNLVHGTLQVTVQVSRVCPKLKFPPDVAFQLRDFESLTLNLPFFQTRNSLPPPDPGAFEEEVEVLSRWFESRFPSCFLPTYPREVAVQTLSYVMGSGVPELVQGSRLFRQVTHMLVVCFMGDDLGDKDPASFLVPDLRLGVKEFNIQSAWNMGVARLWRPFGISDGGAMQRSQHTGPGLMTTLAGCFVRYVLPVIGPSHRMWKWVVGVLSPIPTSEEEKEALVFMRDNRLIYHLSMAALELTAEAAGSVSEILPLMLSGLSPCATNLWTVTHLGGGRRGTEDPSFMEDTVRFFRSEDSGLRNTVDHIYIGAWGYLPSWIYHSALLRHFQTLANKIAAGFNDIAGFEKDLRSGELGSLVLFHLQKGKGGSPKEVLTAEASRVSRYVKDYLWFRSSVLTTFGEDVDKYVALMDSVLSGYAQGCIVSKRFAAEGGKIRFIANIKSNLGYN